MIMRRLGLEADGWQGTSYLRGSNETGKRQGLVTGRMRKERSREDMNMVREELVTLK